MTRSFNRWTLWLHRSQRLSIKAWSKREKSCHKRVREETRKKRMRGSQKWGRKWLDARGPLTLVKGKRRFSKRLRLKEAAGKIRSMLTICLCLLRTKTPSLTSLPLRKVRMSPRLQDKDKTNLSQNWMIKRSKNRSRLTTVPKMKKANHQRIPIPILTPTISTLTQTFSSKLRR